ncbi:MAG: 3-hydroxyacyl-CoA dehydrogenase NAD-binding domain-containing protein, partial [SAR324 cluster bacterium]|nr:3-hydroxyacyl-CoA dehydrogenase NAD-binding domain-containing protein [SAR324 cluster bacterium]
IPDVPRDTAKIEINRAAVVGAGTMGGGIAMTYANAGIPVILKETVQERLDKGMAVIRGNYERSVKRGRFSPEFAEERLALIEPTLSYDKFKEADIVVEAVFEEMALKKEVFAALDKVCRPETILATNTSTLDVDEIAAVTSRPGKVIGAHFFSPANVMRLLEIVRGRESSNETISTTMALARALGKVGVLVGVCHGFVGNRMLHQRNREANFLLEEGALPEQVDRVLFDFGFPMGPFAMGDMAGLDVGWRVRKAQAATRPKDQRYSALGDAICEQGRYGQKTGKGWYRYEPGSRTPLPDPEVEALILKESERLGIARREISAEEIVARTIYPMINEGAKILQEGLAIRGSDIDVIWVYGYGWPRYRGGPMFYADTVGLDNVLQGLKRMEADHGAQFAPAPLLEKLAREGGQFQTYREGA